MQDQEDPYKINNETFYLERDANEDLAGQYGDNIEDQVEKMKKMNPQFGEFYEQVKAGDYSLEQMSKYMGTN